MAIDPIDARGAPKSAVQAAIADRCERIDQKPTCVPLRFEPDNDDDACRAVSAQPDVYSKKITVGTRVTIKLDCSDVADQSRA